MSFSDCWNENVVDFFFSTSGSVVLDNFASKDLISSCSLTTAVLVPSIASTEEEEELMGLKLSSKMWASFINSQSKKEQE